MMKKLEKLVLPKTMKYIGSHAFYDCEKLADIEGLEYDLPVPKKFGYFFRGWYTEETYENRVKSITTETKGLCPKCNSKIIELKSKKGYKYFACEKGKECGFMTWDVPTANNCPNCGKTLFKRRGGLTVCNNEGCGYEVKTTRSKKAKNNE